MTRSPKKGLRRSTVWRAGIVQPSQADFDEVFG